MFLKRSLCWKNRRQNIAPAQDGIANKILIEFLSAFFGLPKSNIIIRSGFTSPFKKIEVISADESIILKKLDAIVS
ncbi:MAG: DUF167 domain-containing protein [Bacteroidetes bacterium]|nr:DUF167 domain-containing protein [Bacteroidota bacterium]